MYERSDSGMTKEIEIKLRKILKERNIEQKTLAEKTGLSVRAISELANDKTERIPKAAINKIADELGIDDIRDLIDFKD